jgi:capsular exopolysaccharide synthesis family protein
MSKYFDQSRQGDDRSARRNGFKAVNVEEVFDVVTKAGAEDAGDISDSRLSRCRKMRLPNSSDKPLIFPRTDISAVALESYRALRTRLLRLQGTNGVRSVVLTSAMAGEGKTLTTANLALCCAQLHEMRVLVIDGDLRTSGLTKLLGDPEGPGLGDVLSGQVDFQDAIQATDNPNLYVLGAGNCSMPAPELFSRTQWKDLIGWCGEIFRVVLVDSPPVLPVADFEQIISACDGVLVVVRALRTNREMLKRTALRVDPKKLLGVVFNGADPEEQAYYSIGHTTPATRKSEVTVEESRSPEQSKVLA